MPPSPQRSMYQRSLSHTDDKRTRTESPAGTSDFAKVSAWNLLLHTVYCCLPDGLTPCGLPPSFYTFSVLYENMNVPLSTQTGWPYGLKMVFHTQTAGNVAPVFSDRVTGCREMHYQPAQQLSHQAPRVTRHPDQAILSPHAEPGPWHTQKVSFLFTF